MLRSIVGTVLSVAILVGVYLMYTQMGYTLTLLGISIPLPVIMVLLGIAVVSQVSELAKRIKERKQ